MSDIRRIIEDNIKSYIATRPRSLQTRIGPSELGMECYRHFAHRIAGVKVEDGEAWLPLIGSAVHDVLSHLLDFDWYTEMLVEVGEVGGQKITGHLDAYHLPTGMIVDFKVVGENTLRAAKRNGPSVQYQTQLQLYAKGAIASGVQVAGVCLAYLPRNNMSLGASHYWFDEVRPAVAEAALDRANQTHEMLEDLRIRHGWAAQEQYLRALPRTADCWDCKRELSAQPIEQGSLMASMLAN